MRLPKRLGKRAERADTSVVVVGRVGERFAAGQAFRHLVAAKHVAKLHGVGHRLDAFRVDFRQLIDEGHDLAQLRGHLLRLGFAQPQPGEEGHLFNVLARDAHGPTAR